MLTRQPLPSRSLRAMVRDLTPSTQSASALQPLGVTARAGATVAVYAQLPTDAPVYVVPTQYFGESGIWSGQAVRLGGR